MTTEREAIFKKWLCYTSVLSSIKDAGNLTLIFNQYPRDIGEWKITQYVTDGKIEVRLLAN